MIKSPFPDQRPYEEASTDQRSSAMGDGVYGIQYPQIASNVA
jgi:hypothetical protein